MNSLPPYCTRCCSKAEERNAGFVTSIPFWFCPECKVEVDFSGNRVYSQEEFDEQYKQNTENMKNPDSDICLELEEEDFKNYLFWP